MGKRRWILWQGLIAPSMERFIVAPSNEGFEFSGLILQADDDVPYVARYTVKVDERWHTRGVQVELEDGGLRGIQLTADGGGRWSRDGQHLGELDDCIDADLEWSPSTNTLPLRRLGLQVGEARTVIAAWVRFPSLQVQRLDQTYQRLAEHRFRYRSGRFSADLAVDDDGMVLQYGVNWKAVASSGELG